MGLRYHVVSLVAVLFALAAGVALGSGPLNDTVDAALGAEQLQQDKQELAADLALGQAEQAVSDAYAESTAALVLPGQLAGSAVLVLALPGADAGDVEAVRTAATAAGGTVTGVVAISDPYLDPAQQSVLDGLLERLSDADLPAGATAERAAVALADALAVEEPAGGDLAETDQSLLTGLAEIGVLAQPTPVTGRAGTVVIVGGDQPIASGTAAEAITALLRAFGAQAAAVVLAGPAGSAGAGGVVALLRGDDRLAEQVASVDLVDSPTGVSITVAAARAALTGQIGHFGTGPDATAAVPPPPTADR